VIELSLTPQGKARVWLQELPVCSYSVTQVLERQLPAGTLQVARPLCAAIEAFLHRGGYCPYGLLGAHFVPARSEGLTIRVGISTCEGQTISKTLAGSIDQVRLGLPLEYAESVLQGAASVGSLSLLGSGTLSFDCAAHGEIGSSSHVFERLAALVVQLIQLNVETTPTEYLTAMVQNTIAS